MFVSLCLCQCLSHISHTPHRHIKTNRHSTDSKLPLSINHKSLRLYRSWQRLLSSRLLTFLHLSNFLSVPWRRFPQQKYVLFIRENREPKLELHLSEVNSTTVRSREIMTVRHSATSPVWNPVCVLPEESRWAAVGWEAAGARMC